MFISLQFSVHSSKPSRASRSSLCLRFELMEPEKNKCCISPGSSNQDFVHSFWANIECIFLCHFLLKKLLNSTFHVVLISAHGGRDNWLIRAMQQETQLVLFVCKFGPNYNAQSLDADWKRRYLMKCLKVCGISIIL